MSKNIPTSPPIHGLGGASTPSKLAQFNHLSGAVILTVSDPSQSLTKKKKAKPQPRKVFNRYLSEADEKQLFNFVGQFKEVLAQRDWAWLMLLRQTGIRVGSLAGLTLANAKDALTNKHLVLAAKHAKNGNGYTVLLNKKAQQAVRQLIKVRKQQGFEPMDDMPLIMSRDHNAMSVRSMQNRMAKWVLASGLKVKATPHWFRHTLAKRIMKNSTADNPLDMVARTLNHSSIETSRLYTTPSKEDMALTMEQAS